MVLDVISGGLLMLQSRGPLDEMELGGRGDARYVGTRTKKLAVA